MSVCQCVFLCVSVCLCVLCVFVCVCACVVCVCVYVCVWCNNKPFASELETHTNEINVSQVSATLYTFMANA